MKLSTDLYVYLCNLSDKIIKRKEAIAGDYLRFSESLTDLTKHSSLTYAIDTSEVRSLDEGLKKAAQHVNSSHKLMLSEADAWNQGLLEDLKTVRDALVSVRELFDRRDRYAKDNIPQLEKRIMSNVQKLAAVKAKGEAAKPGEAEKVENAIATVCIGHPPHPGYRYGILIFSFPWPGQAIHRGAACAGCLHPRMHPRRAAVLPPLAVPGFALAPGLGIPTGQVVGEGCGQLELVGGCGGTHAIGRLAGAQCASGKGSDAYCWRYADADVVLRRCWGRQWLVDGIISLVHWTRFLLVVCILCDSALSLAVSWEMAGHVRYTRVCARPGTGIEVGSHSRHGMW